MYKPLSYATGYMGGPTNQHDEWRQNQPTDTKHQVRFRAQHHFHVFGKVLVSCTWTSYNATPYDDY